MAVILNNHTNRSNLSAKDYAELARGLRGELAPEEVETLKAKLGFIETSDRAHHES